jgi:hypothetical protein
LPSKKQKQPYELNNSRIASIPYLLFLILCLVFAAAAQAVVIPQGGWWLLYVDSQELAGEDGAAANAFDGNPLTIWHTEWSSSIPDYPYEIRIDVGSVCDVDGFRYLPRQAEAYLN